MRNLRFALILCMLASPLLIPSLVMAEDQCTNITCNYVTFTGNLTVEGLETSLTSLADSVANLNTAITGHATTISNAISDTTDNLIGLILLMFIVVLAYWHRDRLLYAFAGLSLLVFGGSFISSNLTIALVLFLIGAYSFVKAALEKRSAKG